MILPLMVRVHWVDSRNEHTRPEYVHELAEDNPVLECVLVGLREFLVQDGFDPVLCPELLLRITLTKDLFGTLKELAHDDLNQTKDVVRISSTVGRSVVSDITS